MLGLAALLAGQIAAARLLHGLGTLPWLRVGWDDPAAWLAVVPAEDAVMAALRLLALAATYWLIASTTAYTLARASHLPGAVRSVQWATLPAVRRVADRAVAVTLAGSAAVVGAQGLALAEVLAPPAVSAPSALPGDPAPAREPAIPAPAPEPEPDADPAPAAGEDPKPAPAGGPGNAPDAASAFPSPERGAATHRVVPGDNLWAIAAGLLGEDATDAEIHGPWRAMVEANRDRLRSGDPDLIFPGEHLVLPGEDPGPAH